MTETVISETTETVVTGSNPTANSQQPTGESQQATDGQKDEAWDEGRARALIEKLRGENRELTKAQKRLSDLEAAENKRKEAEMTELQQAQQKLQELEGQLKDEKLARMRQEAATKTGLPAVFVDRLKGETPEELEADAKKIIEALPRVSKINQQGNPTNPGAGAGAGTTDEERRKFLFG